MIKKISLHKVTVPYFFFKFIVPYFLKSKFSSLALSEIPTAFQNHKFVLPKLFSPQISDQKSGP